ncbi:MAG: hypothetical protein K9K75_00530 [Deltaproteobacteria bacterium]|nr:hypothetical protein [Deltaproteobacteria bacterium]
MKGLGMSKKVLLLVMVAVLFLALPSMLLAKREGNVVTTEWLGKNLSKKDLVIVDVRNFADYKAGHVPGSVNIPLSSLAIDKGGLKNEVPANEDLIDIISEKGIGSSAPVVVVGLAGEKLPDRAGLTRAAWTLKYAGVQDVYVLDGGFEQWLAEKKPVVTELLDVKEKKYRGKIKEGLFVNLSGLQSAKAAGAVVVDVRELVFFNGEQKLPFVGQFGHVEGALNLPTAQVFEGKSYKGRKDLLALAETVVGTDKAKQIVVYCDSGRVATIWALLLDGLGYSNVAVYDGSAQEYGAENAPLKLVK